MIHFILLLLQTRDGQLKDAADIATLKPCTLTLVEGKTMTSSVVVSCAIKV